MSLISELKRRKVLRAAFAYTLVAWLLLQVTDVVIPIFDSPHWIAKLVFFILLAGLPIILVLAWMFDLTNFGVIREQTPVKAASMVGRRSADSMANKEFVRCLACFWTAIVGVGLSFGAATVIHMHESRQIQHELDLLALNVASNIDHAIHSNGEALEVLRSLFMEGQTPGYTTFRAVSENQMASHVSLKAAEWAPRVRAEELDSFLVMMGETYPGYLIKSFDTAGNEESLEQKAEFYPVSFTIPEIGNEDAIGYDLSSEADRASTLHQAMLDARIHQSPALTLVQSGSPGMLLFDPIYESALRPVSLQARKETLRGFVLGVIDIRVLIESVLKSNVILAGFNGVVSVAGDEKPDLEPISSIDNSSGAALSEVHSAAHTSGEYGQEWSITLFPTEEYIEDQYSSDHVIIGIIGVTLSLALAILMSVILNERKEPSRRVTAGLKRISRPEVPWQNYDAEKLDEDHP
jgi:CHASE1-domain containing sensor protein